VDERTYAAAIAEQITTRQRWLAQYDVAKATIAARAGPAPPVAASAGSFGNSATSERSE
jgi:hypothetical protein